MSTHPTIDRLAEVPTRELTVADVVFVLGRTNDFVYSLIHLGKLEAIAMRAESAKAKDYKTTRQRCTYSIPAAAVLTYLVRETSGDKAALLDAVRERFPAYLKLCERVAKPTPAAPPALPKNVIPMHADDRPKPEQLLLFPASA